MYKIFHFFTSAKCWSLLFVLLLQLMTGSVFSQKYTYPQYIDAYKGEAINQMHKYGIPASITLAQGLLESGGGNSLLATKGNNHFGIKVGVGWHGDYMLKDDDAPNEKFRVYDSPLESYEDHSLFLKRGKRYASLFTLATSDYKGWAHGLKKAGYATNPQYAYLLINLIERYNLQQYDTEAGTVYTAAKSEDKRHKTGSADNQIYCSNKSFYIIAKSGDTYQSIGEKFNISQRKLRRYNETSKRYQVKAGDIVYLTAKKRKAAKEYKGKYHVVQSGESLYSISQKYGIKVKALYKANRITDGFQMVVGQYLRIR